MSDPWTCFSLADGMVMRHFTGLGDEVPPYDPLGTWVQGRFSRGTYRLVGGEVVVRPPVPFTRSGTLAADGVAVLALAGLPADTRLDMCWEEGEVLRNDLRVEPVFVGPVTGSPLELTFTRPGRYRLILVNDPAYRPTELVLDVPA